MVDQRFVQQRWQQWCQTPERRLSDENLAPAFIERVGVATLYPASPEFPNFFAAYVGDPNAKTDFGMGDAQRCNIHLALDAGSKIRCLLHGLHSPASHLDTLVSAPCISADLWNAPGAGRTL